MLRSIGFISCGLEKVLAFLVSEKITDMSDGLPQIIIYPCDGPSDQGLEFCEGHFDGIEIRAVWGQEQEPRLDRAHGPGGLEAFVG